MNRITIEGNLSRDREGRSFSHGLAAGDLYWLTAGRARAPRTRCPCC